MTGKEEILQKLAECVMNYDVEATIAVAQEAIKVGVDPVEAIEQGLAKGVKEVGEKFGKKEIFLSELIAAAMAMSEGVEVLKRAIPKGVEIKRLGRFMIGVVSGDIHDIGKNIVVAMLLAAGFEVIDLGVDVSVENFVEKVKELKPDIVGMSALLTTTIPEMKKAIDALKENGLRDKVKVMVGGGPVTESYAKEIGADEWGADAVDAVNKARRLVDVE